MAGAGMTRSKHRRAGGNRCRSCQRPIVLLGSPFTSNWRAFEPTPVNGRAYQGGDAYPSEGKKTYRFRDFVEELMVRRECSRPAAEDEVYDVPWFVLHHCSPTTPAEGEDL